MGFKPALTRADLHVIQERNKSPDIKVLLWEIAPLRAIVLRADQLQATLGNHGGGAGLTAPCNRAVAPALQGFAT